MKKSRREKIIVSQKLNNIFFLLNYYNPSHPQVSAGVGGIMGAGTGLMAPSWIGDNRLNSQMQSPRKAFEHMASKYEQ